MFIILPQKVIFKTLLKNRTILVLALCFPLNLLLAQRALKGTIVEKDSSTVMPFVYMINKRNGNGTMSDNDGKFFLTVGEEDTIICSYVGFAKTYIPARELKPNAKGEVLITMLQMPVNLETVNVTAFVVKPYEREYMNNIIDRSKITTISYFQSPITALYNQFSREGKQIRKLAKIFEDIILEEQVQKKLSREILVKLTGDEHIDYYAFRKYCYYVNDYFIVTHDGVDLYSRVMECYKRWKGDMGGEERQPVNRYRAHD